MNPYVTANASTAEEVVLEAVRHLHAHIPVQYEASWAKTIVGHLTSFGLLVPAGSETRQEWGVWIGPDDCGHIISDARIRDIEAAREQIELRRPWRRTYPGDVRTRTVIETPWVDVQATP